MTQMVSCGNVSSNNCKLVPSDSIIHLDIPSNLSPTAYLQLATLGGEEYLAFQQKGGNIFIFDLNKRLLTKEIRPQKEGPNGLGASVSCFYFINFDTIFVITNGYRDILHIIDSDANLVDEIKIDISYNPYIPISWIGKSSDIFYRDGHLILPNMILQPEGWAERQKYSLGYCYDFKTKGQSRYHVNYPNMILQGEDNPSDAMSFVINDDKTIVRYDHDHYIYVYADSVWTPYYMKSKYANKPLLKQYVGNIDFNEQLKRIVESPRYEYLAYDKYRNVYYRFVYHGETVNDDENVMSQREFHKTFSIMIIDEKFNLIGETLMPDNTYIMDSFFINEKGLWLSTNHPKNPIFEEDAVNFQLLELR